MPFSSPSQSIDSPANICILFGFSWAAKPGFAVLADGPVV